MWTAKAIAPWEDDFRRGRKTFQFIQTNPPKWTILIIFSKWLLRPKFACVTGERIPHYRSSQDFQNLQWGVTPHATNSVFWSLGMIPYLDYQGLPTFQNPTVYLILSFSKSFIFSFRQFNLIFNPEDSTVEMSDNRSRKTFLKKTVTTEVPSRGVYFLNRNIRPWIQAMDKVHLYSLLFLEG